MFKDRDRIPRLWAAGQKPGFYESIVYLLPQREKTPIIHLWLLTSVSWVIHWGVFFVQRTNPPRDFLLSCHWWFFFLFMDLLKEKNLLPVLTFYLLRQYNTKYTKGIANYQITKFILNIRIFKIDIFFKRFQIVKSL